MEEKREPRRYPRYRGVKTVPVAWMTSSGKKDVSKAEGLSMGGLFIRTPTPAEVGSLVLLLFKTPGGDVRVRAMVRDVIPGKGMGMAITSMDTEHRARLSRWLQTLNEEAEKPGGAENRAPVPPKPKK